jgi:hypothetical protein
MNIEMINNFIQQWKYNFEEARGISGDKYTIDRVSMEWFVSQFEEIIKENSELRKTINNIQTEFFKDQSDGYAASNMLKISQSAKVLGGIKTEKKAKSSAENGKKGGRPRKTS